MTSKHEDIEVSYSVSNDFFALWLDRNMHYTSASYMAGDESLEQAQEQAQQHLYYQQQAAAMYVTHPQYQEAQQYAEQYYTHPHGHVDAAAMATQYDPNAAAYAQYYAAQQGYIAQPQTDQQTEFHF